ncbi:MAG: FAD-dependent oxidoreductase [Treponema sp.]|jgi:thioredoxin reductase (NADPH)|nr:FAD-dependent oxidoreductase [Treponema sp.]
MVQGLKADVLIIGGGPAGLTAAQYAARANLDALVIEELAPGGTALLIDRLENYPGFAGEHSGEELATALRSQAEAFGARFVSGTVTALRQEPLRQEGGAFKAVLEGSPEGEAAARAVIIASGSRPRRLGIPGEAEFLGRGVSYCASCDGPFFRGRKIFVVGGGDAACDEAEYLSRLSPQVTLIHRREKFRAQKALAERVLHNPHIEVRFNIRMLEIHGGAQVSSVLLEHIDAGAPSGAPYEAEAAGVFVFTGSEPRTAFLNTGGGCTVETNEGGYILTDQAMAASTPGLFAAGDVRACPFRQIVTAAADGAVAAHSAARYLDSLRGEAY